MTKLRGMRWLMDMAETQSQEMIEMVVKQLYRELNA
jgi:hypothetical protein